MAVNPPSATLDGAVRLLIEVHNELVVDHEQTQEERTKGYDLMRRIDAFIDATSAPSEIARPCTCHPDDNPPVPCPKKYALTECREAALSATRRTTASDVLQVIVDYHRITSGEFNAKYPDKKSWDSEDLIDWAEKEIA